MADPKRSSIPPTLILYSSTGITLLSFNTSFDDRIGVKAVLSRKIFYFTNNIREANDAADYSLSESDKLRTISSHRVIIHQTIVQMK